ncbi:hypothetical protein K3495_g14172 [Podosphaera aphanis]|nr:hypothetical protein K3495_g14172 [Podosphaera aphanis]
MDVQAQLDVLRPSLRTTRSGRVVKPSGHAVEAVIPQNNAQMEVLKPLRGATRFTELTRLTSKGQVFGPIVKQLTNARKAVFINAEESTSLGAPTPPCESITVEQAMEDDEIGWIDAITKELLALQSTGTFTIIKGEPPVGRKLISSRLVLRYKLGANSTERVKKARVVARGFEQQAGLDYFETFASVVRYNTLRIILAIAATKNLEIDSIDINTAFLNPLLKEETYMQLPPMFELLDPTVDRKSHFLKLNKSIYGLK